MSVDGRKLIFGKTLRKLPFGGIFFEKNDKNCSFSIESFIFIWCNSLCAKRLS